MLGFSAFASAPFAATGSSAIVTQEADFYCEALLEANANAEWYTDADMTGEAILDADSTIVGSGWTRINPDTPEWDMTQSQDWNRIK